MAKRCSHSCKKHCGSKPKSSKRRRTQRRGRGQRGGAHTPLSPAPAN